MPRIVVYHGAYGCESGCCGHYIEIDDKYVSESWTFDHPFDEDVLAWARWHVRETLGEEHVADLDWENCVVSRD